MSRNVKRPMGNCLSTRTPITNIRKKRAVLLQILQRLEGKLKYYKQHKVKKIRTIVRLEKLGRETD